MSPTEGDDDRLARNGDSMQAPPATFDFLLHTLFTQALMALGRIPNPITKQSTRNVAAAQHFIDMLALLEQKTTGNLTTDEKRLLEEIQHQVRLFFVSEPESDHASSPSTPE